MINYPTRKLELVPHGVYHRILLAYLEGKPLTQDQLALLRGHHGHLPAEFGYISDYYLNGHRLFLKKAQATEKSPTEKPRFILAGEIVNALDLQDLWNLVNEEIKKNKQGIEIQLKSDQLKFKMDQEKLGPTEEASSIEEFLSLEDAPYVGFFQWEHLFAAIKYDSLGGEKVILADVLIDFEEANDRELAEYKAEYLAKQAALQNEKHFTPELRRALEQEIEIDHPELMSRLPIPRPH